ncbi:MAG: hypothetical protein ACRDVF_01590 [Microbacterium sp.]
MDEYLSLKHGTGKPSVALGALFRDRYGDDCSVLDCRDVAESTLILLNAPTIALPLCGKHLAQTKHSYSDLLEHLPEMTSGARALLFDLQDSESLSVSQSADDVDSELRDDDEPAGSPRSAGER